MTQFDPGLSARLMLGGMAEGRMNTLGAFDAHFGQSQLDERADERRRRMASNYLMGSTTLGLPLNDRDVENYPELFNQPEDRFLAQMVAPQENPGVAEAMARKLDASDATRNSTQPDLYANPLERAFVHHYAQFPGATWKDRVMSAAQAQAEREMGGTLNPENLGRQGYTPEQGYAIGAMFRMTEPAKRADLVGKVYGIGEKGKGPNIEGAAKLREEMDIIRGQMQSETDPARQQSQQRRLQAMEKMYDDMMGLGRYQDQEQAPERGQGSIGKLLQQKGVGAGVADPTGRVLELYLGSGGLTAEKIDDVLMQALVRHITTRVAAGSMPTTPEAILADPKIRAIIMGAAEEQAKPTPKKQTSTYKGGLTLGADRTMQRPTVNGALGGGGSMNGRP